MAANRGWIGMDLDGTLAEYDSDNFDPLVIGKPIPLMIATAKAYLAKGTTVKIVTARIGKRRDSTEDVDAIRKAIEDWCEEHIGQRLEVTDTKDYRMITLYDDRVRQVIPNTGVTMGQLVAALRRMLEHTGETIEYSPDTEDYLQDQEKL